MRREEVQPYYRAFMLERGYDVADPSQTVDYIIWNNQRWREFACSLGLAPEGFQSEFYRKEFGEWLERRSLEHQCVDQTQYFLNDS